MLIYFAGPLFSEAEKRFNADLTEKLEALGFQVFLPQRDGPELNRPGYDQLPREERRRQVFELDARMVMECDVFLIVLAFSIHERPGRVARRCQSGSPG
jgi:nucleoside 2-deoxyribosyltransferase